MQRQTSPVARFLLVMAAFIIVVAGMRAAESLLVPFLLSLFIAVIVTPLLAWLNGRGLPNWLSILLIVLAIVVVGFFIGTIVGSSINSFRSDLPEYQARLVTLSDGLQQKLASVGITIDPSQWREMFNPSAALAVAGNTLGAFGNIMTNGFLILLTVMFILAEEVNFSVSQLMVDWGGLSCALGLVSLSIEFYSYFRFDISCCTTCAVSDCSIRHTRGLSCGCSLFGCKYDCRKCSRSSLYG